MSLVSPKSIETALATHYLDSLRIADFGHRFAVGERTLDLGTGAGFPGLVYAIRYPKRPIVLYEKSLKKQTFLTAAVTQLGLTNVELQGLMAHGKHHALVFARAVMPPPELLPFLKKQLVRGSTVILNTGGSSPVVELPKYFERLATEEYELPLGCGRRRVEALRLL